SKYQVGQRVVMHNDSPPNNIDYETTSNVMAFDVVAEASDTRNNEVPYDLNPHEPTMLLQESDSIRTRKLEFERKNGQWTINGTTWDDVVNSDYQFVLANPGLNDVEIWELQNPHGGWFHPIHIHLVDFKVLDRNGQPPFDYERGPKDVVYVGENETVRVLMRFEHEQGRYMMHCHNLVHEDHDMMGQFLVGEDSPECDPIFADKPARKPARSIHSRHDDPEDDHGGSGGGGGDSSGSGSGGGGGDNSGPGNADDRLAASSIGAGATTSSIVKKKVTCAPKKKPTLVKKKAKKSIAKSKPLVKAKSSATKKKTAATCVTPLKKKPVAKRKPVSKRKPSPAAKRRALLKSR
ncbi:MAG TPA: multicopper oxidase domain-containing protein, partial [Solirubrobacteraceae bacterium]|nr:multicopper oxidase domain-containing protein [Solirubrobacteraceae bacterium]